MRLAVLTIALFAASTLFAETLLMQNGTVIRGKIAAQDRVNVTIDTAAGQLAIPKAQIRRIVFDDAKYDAELRKAEEDRLKLEQQRLEAENRRLAEERRRKDEEKKTSIPSNTGPATPVEPSIEKTGFIIGAALSTNRYDSAVVGFTREDRQNPMNIFNLPILINGVRTEGYGAFMLHAGYQGRRWYALAEGMQLRGHSKFDELGAGYSFLQSPSPSLRGMVGQGIAALQRDALTSRIAFTPVPLRWWFRPYVYGGFGGTRINGRLDYVDLNPNFSASPSTSLISGRTRTAMEGSGPELGMDVRFVRENGFEVRLLYGQAWHSGEFRTTGDIMAVRLGIASSIMDNLWLRPKLIGGVDMHIQKYAMTVYTPRIGPGRIFAGFRSEHSKVLISKILPDYFPVTELTLLSGSVASVFPDLAFKQGRTRVPDLFQGYMIGWESVLSVWMFRLDRLATWQTSHQCESAS